MENGQLSIMDEEFDLHGVIQSVYNMLLPSATNKQLDFILTINDKLPQYVIGDRMRTQRILTNVIANAIKFTENGYVKLIVTAVPQSKREIVVSFLIEDTGIGIPDDKKGMVFERFNRLTSSYSGVYPGKGLGLKIVKQFLDEISGHVYLNSKVGEGTKFKILIPYQLPLLSSSEKSQLELEETKTTKLAAKSIDEKIVAAQKRNLSSAANLLTPLSKILLVEDHQIAARMAKIILSELACEVDVAENGKTALDLVQKNHYDLIFMDIGLPDMDGCNVVKQIRSYANMAQTPIVALTAHAEQEEKQRCLDAGMNKAITKPLTKKWAESILSTFIPEREKQKRQMKEVVEAIADIKPAGKILDVEYAKALLGGNEAVVQEMLKTFVDSLPEEIKALEAAYEEKDWQQLKALAHKLKGGASYCGTLRLKLACSELDTYIKSGTTEKISALYQRILEEINRVQNFIKTQSS